MSLYNDVYGLSYVKAEEQINIVKQAILQQEGNPFETKEELEKWAHDFHLDKVILNRMSHKFLNVSHRGEIITSADFSNYYSTVLNYQVAENDRRIKVSSWLPEGVKYYANAYINGEQSDGIHKPLYYRDYFVPTGYYNEAKDAFNSAKPFPVFAKETGRDTSHIYTYINHIAGECSLWLLAWLRAKMLYPTVKTQVVPILVSKAQGSGKTTFAEVICKGMFGSDNVLVTDQYDATARFNADYADALIVCQEEKEETDRRNPAGTLKSRATATTIRKECKGIDPVYQESYTEFIMTTNKDVPIKFDGREDQRRFMVMEADANFTRKTSKLADEVFSKLYGFDANYNKVGTPFTEDKDLISQFKHELFTRQDIANVNLRDFPKTTAYNKCFSIPRTNESTDIENILRALAPFIKQTLLQKKTVTTIVDGDVTLNLSDIVQATQALQYIPSVSGKEYVAICRPLAFYEMGTNKPFAHSLVERGIYDSADWLHDEYGIDIISDMSCLPGGFPGIAGRYRMAPAARFKLADESNYYDTLDDDNTDYSSGNNNHIAPNVNPSLERKGERLKVNDKFIPDRTGCFETVNEIESGWKSLKDKTKHVTYLDTFLLESDTPSKIQEQLEKARVLNLRALGKESVTAEELYAERLSTALSESTKLFNKGIVARIVYSGAKSYHLMIRVKDSPLSLEEYKWLHAYLCSSVSDILIFDESTSDPARLTRSPITIPRITSAYDLQIIGTQKLIAEDWSHVYDLRWRELYVNWQHRPLNTYEQKKGRPLMPTAKCYKEAVDGIMNGVFWTDMKYDGSRQKLFFPAYRLLRTLGYSHDELWNDILLKNLDKYSKPDEISYWKSRATSKLIREIDNSIVDIEEVRHG